jgi:small subunit ribosomal protein S6
MAYPIQKQTDGIYSFITFEAEPGAPAEIESRIRIMENVLRFLITRVEQ